MFSKTCHKNTVQGMTLVELVIATALASLLLIGTASFIIFTSRGMAGMFNYVDLDTSSRHAQQVITREIRQATRLKEYGTNRLVLVDFDGADLVYEYLPDTKTLVRQKGNSQDTLLTGCDSCRFSLYKQNPVKGTHNLTSTTNTAKAKVIGLYWNCSRSVLGTVNSEPMQEALVVVRKS